ncbi:MAG: phenylalanine--tRNA ligase subunit beta [Candidatus Eremiobacteraeota bacterium]|nr:phenylalanine--tRNA ligase subunit beta [Candidatus Eremiobacteraeota bacterium]
MKLPIAWLRDYVDISLSSDEIAERLALLGFPVDAIERRPKLSGIVAGRLVKVEKHPNADRLSICTVGVAAGKPLTIVTAATNVAEGQTVPVATIGAKLVNLDIAPRAMRGVDSEGMLVSADEIGLEGAWFEDGILQLEPTVPPGTDFVKAYRLDDDVLDVEVTSNRVDAMSVVGLARELAAALGSVVRGPDTEVALTQGASQATTPDTSVTLESADCRRFVAQRFSNLTVRPSPFSMRLRLALAGQRPIDNLVDISNFVMLEIGQPLHFYDFDKLAERRLVVRDARPGEKMTTLDGEERTLDPSFLVIADGERAQCIAGLRGARDSEVSASTRELLLEAASFSGPRIRRMSLALGVRTDASTRHEKTLPLALGSLGASRAAHLLQREGATVAMPFAVGAPIEPPAPIRVSAQDAHRLLGMLVTGDEIQLALTGLGFSLERDGETFVATPPEWRNDLRIREDVIEEIGRVAGYDRIASAIPPVFDQAVSSAAYDGERRIARALAGVGYREAVTFALQPASVRETYERAGIPLPGEVVEVTNPLSEDQRYLRFSLLPALLGLVRRYEGDMPYRGFEIGHIFFGAPDPLETAAVAWVCAIRKVPDEPAWRDDGFLAFKSDSLAFARMLAGTDAVTVATRHGEFHPGKTASLSIHDEDVATIGAIDPRLLAAYGIQSAAYAGVMRLADLPAYRVPRFAERSKYPPVERDLALVVAPEIAAMDIESAVRAGADGVVASVRVFDEYRGPQVEAGKKSIAVRILLQRRDATLTDAEADGYIAAISASLQERCGAVLRS